MDFLEQLKAWIEANVPLFSPVVFLGTLQDGDSVAIRPTPSVPPRRYMDRSKEYTYAFQLLVRHADQKTAYSTAQALEFAIFDLMGDDISSANESFVLVKVDVNVTTNFVERDSRGWVYTALFQALLQVPAIT